MKGTMSDWRDWDQNETSDRLPNNHAGGGNPRHPNHQNNCCTDNNDRDRERNWTASGSRSDPISTPNDHRSYADRDRDGDPYYHSSGGSEPGRRSHGHHYGGSPPHGYSHQREYSRSSSFTGFQSAPHQEDTNDDEPTDVLVWDSQKSHNNDASHSNRRPTAYQRSLSDTEESSSVLLRPKTSGTVYSRRGYGSRSRLVKSLDKIKSQATDDLNDNGEDDQLSGLTKQLEMIKGTQDSILNQLSDEMSTLQFENVQLKNTNEHLTMQNSHLLQVITDLSSEVEHMREVFRVRGWSLQKISKDELSKSESKKSSSSNKEKDKDTDESRSLRHHRSGNASSSDQTSSARSSRSHRRHKKLEAVPLTEETSPTSITSTPPGDEQVATLAKRGNHGELKAGTGSGRKRSSRSRPKSQPIDDEPPDNNNCFKNLFRRKKNYNRSSHSTSVDRLSSSLR